MISVSATLDGEKLISANLSRLDSKLNNPRPVFRNIDRYMQEQIQSNYSRRGGMYGGWSPRKDSKPHPLLEETGSMRGAFEGNIGRRKLTIRNTDPKFKWHQRGTSRGVPARPMLGINTEQRRYILKEFQKYVVYSARGQNYS